jgi:DNA-directed RNA polymerase subunit RPC12/RpoP
MDSTIGGVKKKQMQQDGDNMCRARYFTHPSTLPPQQVSHVDKPKAVDIHEDDVGKEMEMKCQYCGKRQVIEGRSTCFNSHCIESHALANFPQRVRVTTVVDDNDSSQSDSNASDNDNCDWDNVSVDSDGSSSSYDDSNSSYISSKGNEENDKSEGEESRSCSDRLHLATIGCYTSYTEDSLVGNFGSSEDSEETPIPPMCENCHRHAAFKNEEGINITKLPYYLR